MSYLEFIGYFGAFLTGIVIGLFGGGGSILAVPIFVYLFKLNPVIATSYSMFVVGSSAAIGTLINLKKKLIEYKTAGIFTLASTGVCISDTPFFNPQYSRGAAIF